MAGSYTLCSFGGAGGQHACLVADALGITSVFLHPYAGVLSAFGMGLADIRTFEEAVMEKPLEGWWIMLTRPLEHTHIDSPSLSISLDEPLLMELCTR